MNNLLQRLAHWLRSLFRRSEPVEFAPALSREKETVMLKVLETRQALNDELTIDHYWAAWLAEFEAKQYAPSRGAQAVKEGLDAIYPKENNV